jgi:hypothetical protein
MMDWNTLHVATAISKHVAFAKSQSYNYQFEKESVFFMQTLHQAMKKKSVQRKSCSKAQELLCLVETILDNVSDHLSDPSIEHQSAVRELLVEIRELNNTN